MSTVLLPNVCMPASSANYNKAVSVIDAGFDHSSISRLVVCQAVHVSYAAGGGIFSFLHGGDGGTGPYDDDGEPD